MAVNVLIGYLNVSAVKSHHQAKIEQCLGTMKVCSLWDPIDCTLSFYLDIVLFWPDDGSLQPKHVAKILKYYQFADIYIYIYCVLDGIKI